MVLKQEKRQLSIDTPLGKDVLVLTAFNGTEEMSRLFNYELELISDNNAISPSEIVGKNVTVGIKLADGSDRYFNGFVSRFVAGDEGHDRRNYRAQVVPWLWFLTRTADCRIFQDQTVPDILEKIFDDLGFSDFETSEIKGTHEEWEYCVQYRETDFNFVSRLMEQEGIFYYFRHEDGKHTLVLADQKGAYQDCDENEVDYPRDYGTRPITDHITSWEHGYEFTPGKWSQTDSANFKDHPARAERTPSNLLMTEEQTTVDLPNIGKYEVYDYPGGYPEKEWGSAYTKIRMEEEEVDHDVVRAGSTCRTFTPGGKFKVKSHRSDSEKDKTFVITWIKHTVSQPYTYESGGSTGTEYTNAFSCIPDSVTFRPRRVTPKPSIRGSQTAVVTGPDGEEIWPDEYGRVMVQFPWDREGKRDETTSCWIRCAQTSAGKGWGSMFLPRVGQEVVVSYLEGDPDRPLITGVVYNADQMPPYTLPDEKTKSYIKTCSSKDAEGYNELRFEDKKDSEQIFIHAQKDIDTRVKAVSKDRIGGDRHKIIGSEEDKAGDEKELVYRDRHLKSHRHREEHVGGDMKLTVGGVDGPGNQDIVIKGDKKESVGGDSHVHVTGSRNEKVDTNQSLTVGMNQQEKVGLSHALQAGAGIHLKGGTDVMIEAGAGLTLKCGESSISITPAAIFIQGGPIVNINSGAGPGYGAGSSPTEPQDAAEAAPDKPDEADDSTSGQVSTPF